MIAYFNFQLQPEQLAKREELINRLENVREDNIKAKLRREASERQKEIESLQKIQQSSQIGQRMHSYTPMVDVGKLITAHRFLIHLIHLNQFLIRASK